MSDANPVVGILDDEIDFVRKASTRAESAEARARELESQCAAMREALVQISKMRCCGGWGGACGEADKAAGVADDALSGDAGRALLERDEEKDRRIEALERVADAARKYRDTDWEDRWREFDAFSNAIDVIDALEPKR